MAPPVPADRLRPVILPLLRTILTEELGEGAAPEPELLRQTAATMERKLVQMPRYMGLGIAALTLVFDAGGLRFGGHAFRDNPPEAQRAQARSWRFSRVPFCRDFMDFWGKMGVFVYWSHHEGEQG